MTNRLTVVILLTMTTDETLRPLAVAMKRFPVDPEHPLKRPTVMRWISEGCGGVRLEAVRVGGRWMLSDAAISRFLSSRNETRAEVPDRFVAVESRVSNWISGVRGGLDASSSTGGHLSAVPKTTSRRARSVRQAVLPSGEATD